MDGGVEGGRKITDSRVDKGLAMANIGGWRQELMELSDLCRLSSKRRREEDQRLEGTR